MRDIDVVEGVVSSSEFASDVNRFLRGVRSSDRPLLITDEGRTTAVILSPAAFDELRTVRDWLQAVDEGVEEADRGELVEHSRVERWLASLGTAQEVPPPA